MNRGIELDSSRYPLVIMHASANCTQTDWKQLIKRVTELIQLGPFGLINDTRGSALPDPLQRRSIAQMYTDHEALVRKHFRAAAIVGSSNLVNGVLTALSWLKPPPHPVKVFLAMDAAEAWVLSRFSTEMCERTASASARSVISSAT